MEIHNDVTLFYKNVGKNNIHVCIYMLAKLVLTFEIVN